MFAYDTISFSSTRQTLACAGYLRTPAGNFVEHLSSPTTRHCVLMDGSHDKGPLRVRSRYCVCVSGNTIVQDLVGFNTVINNTVATVHGRSPTFTCMIARVPRSAGTLNVRNIVAHCVAAHVHFRTVIQHFCCTTKRVLYPNALIVLYKTFNICSEHSPHKNDYLIYYGYSCS